MHRDNKGRFAKSKKLLKLTVLAGVIATGIYFLNWHEAKWEIINASTATSTKPTRLEQTQELINQLAEQRKKDESFIKETERQMEELKKNREAQARIDALMIVKTQLEVEIANLEN